MVDSKEDVKPNGTQEGDANTQQGDITPPPNAPDYVNPNADKGDTTNTNTNVKQEAPRPSSSNEGGRV